MSYCQVVREMVEAGLLGFFETPRAVGDPFQKIVYSEQEILEFINPRLGKKPIFISHNSYPTMINNDEPYQINVRKLFFDFDSKRKPENAQVDLIKLLDFCDKEKLALYTAFSGSKGFHAYLPLKPTTYLYGKFLQDATRAIHLWLKQTLELRTIDIRCAEPKRLCRVWYTPHVTFNPKNGDTSINGLYCCPLYPEWVREWRMEQILEYARQPEMIEYKLKGRLYSIDEFITKFGIDIEKLLRAEVNSEGNDSRCKIAKYIPVENEFIRYVIPFPCVHNQMVHNPNPPHLARFATVVWLQQLGYTRKWVFDFLQGRNFVDTKSSVCAYQINQIYDHYPPYKFPSCQKIFEESMCVGKDCPKFNAFAAKAGIVGTGMEK